MIWRANKWIYIYIYIIYIYDSQREKTFLKYFGLMPSSVIYIYNDLSDERVKEEIYNNSKVWNNSL